MHDGLYWRGSAGASLLRVARTTEQRGSGDNPLFGGNDSRLRGGVPSLALAGGAFVAPRLVLAGAVHFDWMRQGELALSEGARYRLGAPVYFVTVAPEVVVFRTLDGGFYFGLGAGFVGMFAQTPEPTFDRMGGLGAGVHLSGGYSWWIGPRTGLGVELRARFAQVGARRSQGGTQVSETDTITGLTLAVSVLQH